MTDASDVERLILLLAVVFILILTGCVAPLPNQPRSDTGELTVAVTNQDGVPQRNTEVTVKHAETGTVVYEGDTSPNGKIQTTVEEGTYVVSAADTKKTVNVRGVTEVMLGIVTAPSNLRG